jgi:ABC-type Zn uptake system ZnuABC Zn-binding protein ZnuA
LRKALLGLTKKTKEPTPEDVKEAITSLNVAYKPLSFLEATKGIKFYEAVSREFKVSATPTVVMRNAKTGKSVKLVGIKEISELNLIKAADQVSQ